MCKALLVYKCLLFVRLLLVEVVFISCFLLLLLEGGFFFVGGFVDV